MLLLLLLQLACTSSDGTTCPAGSHLEADGLCHLDEDTGAPAASGGGLDVEGGPSAPTWTADEVMDRLDQALASGLANTPPIGELYESYMDHREPTCPSMEDPTSTVVYGVWQSDACVTGEGWIFDGLAAYAGGCVPPDENKEEPGTGAHEQGMVAQFAMTDPDGAVFSGGGSAVHSCRWYSDGSGSCFDQLGGSFSHPSAYGWMTGGVEASLFVDHLWGGEEGRSTTLVGGIGYAELDLSFDELVIDWDACDGHPTGVLRLRDPTSYWHELHFEDDCSGCGQLSWRGQDEGRFCPDLETALEQVLSAWETPCWD